MKRSRVSWILAAVLAVFSTNLSLAKAPKNPGQTPPPVSAGEILRSQQVRERTRELLRTREFLNAQDARRRAEKDFPQNDFSQSEWSTKYEAWRKYRIEQRKFEDNFVRSVNEAKTN